MQTFLPYRSFIESARCLDYSRLGKQRVEAYQIIKTIEENRKAWANHPAVLMWRNHIRELKFYFDCMVTEWAKRGYKNNYPLLFKTSDSLQVIHTPYWITEKLIISHRSNLLRKDPEYYSQFNWGVPNNLPYYWPVTKAMLTK